MQFATDSLKYTRAYYIFRHDSRPWDIGVKKVQKVPAGNLNRTYNLDEGL